MARGTHQPDPAKRLTEAQDRFIATWGQMGSTWGISRTMAEVHALLYIGGEPLCTDDVMDRLEISRGNASMSLRALVDWGIIERIHKRGDRKEYYQAEQDPWFILRAVVTERMSCEIHPVLAGMAEIRDSTSGVISPKPGVAPDDKQAESAIETKTAAHNQRLDAMLGVLELLSGLGDKFLALPAEQLRDAASAISAGSEAGGRP